MNPLYAIGIIESIRIISQSNLGKTVKNKIGLESDSKIQKKLDSLEARMWELEQMIHKLCTINGGKNE